MYIEIISMICTSLSINDGEFSLTSYIDLPILALVFTPGAGEAFCRGVLPEKGYAYTRGPLDLLVHTFLLEAISITGESCPMSHPNERAG
jgi:hypothetical protein